MKPEIPINQILNGDALMHLKELPNESINCVMTSPPYWALRDYGSSVESIWDGKQDCEHSFEVKERKLHGGSTKSHIQASVDQVGGIPTDWKTQDGFCSNCGAWKGQLGLEPTFDLYIKHLCDIFDEVKRVLRKDGTCWVNLGDTYYSVSGGKFENDNISSKNKNELSGISKANKLKEGDELKQKNLCNLPARFSIEMQNRGWILRNVIIWHKPNCMPSSVKDRFTVDFEYLFFFVKNKKYWFETQYEPSQYRDAQGNLSEKARLSRANAGWDGREVSGIGRNQPQKCEEMGERWCPPKRNKRAVWRICPRSFSEAHFATYPEELCETPIKAGCLVGGIVLDPFFGAGTTGLVALKQNKNFIGIELNPEYIKIAKKRLEPYLSQTKLFNQEK